MTAAPPPPGSHECMRPGCTRRVPNRLYACAPDWFALPREVRSLIFQTARLPLLNSRRRYAVRAAREAWTGGEEA